MSITHVSREPEKKKKESVLDLKDMPNDGDNRRLWMRKGRKVVESTADRAVLLGGDVLRCVQAASCHWAETPRPGVAQLPRKRGRGMEEKMKQQKTDFPLVFLLCVSLTTGHSVPSVHGTFPET